MLETTAGVAAEDDELKDREDVERAPDAAAEDPLAAILVAEPEPGGEPGVATAPEAVEHAPSETFPAAGPAAGAGPPPFDRREFLEPYLEPLTAALEAAEHLDDDQALVLQFAGENVEIDPWARSIAARVLLDGEGGLGNDSASRIVETLALEAKIREDLARYRIASSLALPVGGDPSGGPPSEEGTQTISLRAPEHLQQEILHDAALGFALGSELQRMIDASVVHGRMEQAKALSAFRPTLSHALVGVRELLDEDERAQAQVMAEALRSLPDDAELPEIQPRRRRRRRSAGDAAVVTPSARVSPDASQRRIRLMVVALVGLVALWSVLILPRLMQERLPEFSLSDFRKVQTVISVTARPPSLYVTVDGSAWSRLKPRQRENVVREIAFDLKRAGYTGARFTTANGVTVAQWLRARGVELIEPGESKDRKKDSGAGTP